MSIKYKLSKPFLPLLAQAGGVALRVGFLSVAASEQLFAVLNRYVSPHAFLFHAKTLFGDKVKCNTRDFIQNKIFYFGQWEPRLTAYLLNKIPNDGIFLDIGANIGYFSLLASHRYRKVISFEASSKIFQLLIDNIKLNSRENITAHQVAIGKEEREVYINLGPDSNIGTTSISTEHGPSTVENVKMAPFQVFLTMEELADVRFIKIDIEGAEPSVIEGLVDSLPNMHSSLELVIEVTPSSDPKEQIAREKMFESLLAHRFTAKIMQEAYNIGDYVRTPDISALTPLSTFPNKQTDVLFSRK